MHTWWIVKSGGKLIISMYSMLYRHQSSVGPYWTVTEALDMIERWR